MEDWKQKFTIYDFEQCNGNYLPPFERNRPVTTFSKFQVHLDEEISPWSSDQMPNILLPTNPLYSPHIAAVQSHYQRVNRSKRPKTTTGTIFRRNIKYYHQIQQNDKPSSLNIEKKQVLAISRNQKQDEELNSMLLQSNSLLVNNDSLVQNISPDFQYLDSTKAPLKANDGTTSYTARESFLKRIAKSYQLNATSDPEIGRNNIIRSPTIPELPLQNTKNNLDSNRSSFRPITSLGRSNRSSHIDLATLFQKIQQEQRINTNTQRLISGHPAFDSGVENPTYSSPPEPQDIEKKSSIILSDRGKQRPEPTEKTYLIKKMDNFKLSPSKSPYLITNSKKGAHLKKNQSEEDKHHRLKSQFSPLIQRQKLQNVQTKNFHLVNFLSLKKSQLSIEPIITSKLRDLKSIRGTTFSKIKFMISAPSTVIHKVTPSRDENLATICPIQSYENIAQIKKGRRIKQSKSGTELHAAILQSRNLRAFKSQFLHSYSFN